MCRSLSSKTVSYLVATKYFYIHPTPFMCNKLNFYNIIPRVNAGTTYNGEAYMNGYKCMLIQKCRCLNKTLI